MGGHIARIPGRPTAADFATYCQENLEQDRSSLSGGTSLEDFQMPGIDRDLMSGGDAEQIRNGIVYHIFFVTNMGYMAAAVGAGVRSGDMICILYGT